MIDCGEAVRRMWAYLDRSLDAAPVTEFEEHLDTCRRCCGELEFNRHLRGVVAARAEDPAVPPEMRVRIEQLLADESEGPSGAPA